MEQLVAILFLAVANKSIIDNIFAPLKQRFPEKNWWWVVYVALFTGFAISWFSGADVFSVYIQEPVVSKILTAFCVGGGSSLIHDIFDSKDRI